MVNTFSFQCYVSYRNQSLDLQSKANEWFIYEMQDWAVMD